jgi:hypothetical protein
MLSAVWAALVENASVCVDALHMLSLDLSPLRAGADDADGAAEPAAASDSDQGFEMLDVEPSADTGKKWRALELTECQAVDGPLLPVGRQGRMSSCRLSLCDVMRIWAYIPTGTSWQGQKQQRRSGSGSVKLQMLRTAQTMRPGRHRVSSGQHWQTASAPCWQTLTTMT